MNVGVRRIGAVMLVMFVALIGQLTYVQVARSDKLSTDPRNPRESLRDASRPRGPIVTADGVIVAESKPTNDEVKYQRIYPAATAKLFGHVVGYQSVNLGETGVERTYADDLTGRTFKLQTSDLADLVAGRQPTGTVVLTLSNAIQQLAANALNGANGSVVVLDVQTGGVVAAYSNPTYDPNLFTSHQQSVAQRNAAFLQKVPGNPLLPRAWAERFPPGSTFKTVTASLALQNNIDVDKKFPNVKQIVLPQTDGVTLANFGHETCGGSLLDSFIVSCNTTYAQVGFDLGEAFASGIQNFGIETAPPPSGGASGIDPPIARSTGPDPGTFQHNQPKFMQAAIGQNQVAVTPMQMALVAEAIATGGTMLDPHFVACVKDPDDRVVKTVGPTEYKRAIDPNVAEQMRQFMLGVVNDRKGTGTAAQIPGIQVAGKTGTAETAPNQPPHAWFIAFAPADHPRYAVSVLVEHGGSDNAETTGGRVAAPIAKLLLQALLSSPATNAQCGSGQP